MKFKAFISLALLTYCLTSYAAINYDYAALYFDGGDRTGLKVAGSNDGLTWTPISINAFSPNVGDWGIFRDPSFDKGPDGVYHLVWTTGSNGFGHATSTDLVTWSNANYIRIDKGILSSAGYMTWAPEVYWDANSQSYIIIFSTATRNPNTSCMWAGNFKGYYITTTNWTTFTNPQKLLVPDNAYWMIDGALMQANGKYYYFVKIEDTDTLNGCQSKDGIHYASATSIAGPWTSLSTSRLPGNVDNSEGPSPIKIGNYYYVYYDYTPGLRAARSTDLVNWEDVSGLLNAPSNFRHGTIRQIRSATNQAPSVSITSPSNGSTFTAPASITINANASDADGSVSKVEFFQGSTKLGEDLSSPYSFTWGSVAAGTYSLTAKAIDNNGAVTTSGSISITVNNPANQVPSVSITSPSNGSTFTAPASITINANASDADGSVSKVEFFQGSTKLGEDLSSPYSFTWGSVAAGTYSLTAKATDNVGAVTTSSAISVTVSPSTTSPWSNVDIGAVAAAGSMSQSGITYTIRGSGADIWETSDEFNYMYQTLSGDGAIAAKVVSITNTDPWAKAGVMIREALTANSKHALMAVTSQNGMAFQRRNNTGGSSLHSAGASVAAPYWVKLVRTGSTLTGYQSIDGISWSPVGSDVVSMAGQVYIGLAVTSHNDGVINTSVFENVTVTTNIINQVPSVAITSPVSGASFTAPASIVINANATDADGSISKVEFFQGTTKLGEDLSSPYTFTWGSVVAGTYSLTVKATDNAGAVTTSSSISIIVNNPANQAPSVSITSPSNGSTFTAPASIVINANAIDADGSISKVEFFQGATKLGEDLTSPYSFTWSNVTFGTYSLSAKATDNSGAVTTSGSISVTVSAAPTSWANTDIGAVAVAGSMSQSGSTFTVRGSGADIWDFADEFQYVYKPLNGDGQLVAKIASITNTDVWAKAGVMIRESLTNNSKHAYMAITSSNGVAFQRRVTTGGASSHTAGSMVATPYWVKIVRSGSTITGYQSIDGNTWVTVGSENISMVSQVYIGLAVTSHNDGVINTAVFESVQ